MKRKKVTRHTAERESLPFMYKLVIKNSAKEELDDISAAQFLKIDAAILLLKTNPHPFPQSKKLKGEGR